MDPKGLSWYYSDVDGSFVSHIDDDDDKIYLISQEQINNANGDKNTLRSYRSDNNLFGQKGLENDLNDNVARGVISDLFDRANKKTEGGQDTYITKPEEIIIQHDPSGDEASSTTTSLYVNLVRSGFFNGYDAINLLSHEIGHTLHRKQVGNKAFSKLSNNVKEKQADLFSITHWSYNKTSNTRKEKINNHMKQ